MKKLGLVAVLAVLATGLVAVPSVSAQAPQPSTTCLPFPWESEQQLKFLPFVSPNGNDCWRPVLWPGTGNLLNRQQVNQHTAHYDDQGYNRNFLWYAPEETIEIGDYASRSWTGCNQIPTGVNQLCTSLNTSNLGADFDLSKNPTLTVLRWGSDWIALVCGNNLVRESSDTPIPTIPVDKFIDENRNGVIDAGDVTTGSKVAGVTFEVWRTSSPSWVGQSTGKVATLSTNSNGDATFVLDGHGPGTYEVREIVPSGSIATTSTVRTVEVGAGIGDRRFPVQRFGNAPSNVDVEKVEFTISEIPGELDVRTDTDIAVDVTIRNNGPADNVPVRDTVIARGEDDCVITDPRRTIDRVLDVGESFSTTFVFTFNCDDPSFHDFSFDDELVVTDERLTDTNLANNTATVTDTKPVIAETDLSTTTALVCPGSTDVGVAITCDLDVAVTNTGYGALDATVEVAIAQTFELDDCVIEPASITYDASGLADGEARTFEDDVTVECSHRSFHTVAADTTVDAVDIHVIDTDPSNDASSASADFEVFHDAELDALDIRPFCTETIGGGAFACTAEVDVENRGPAPEVSVDIDIAIAGFAESTPCTFGPAATQTEPGLLSIGTVETVTFTWQVTCEPSNVLHPFEFTADVHPADTEPHAVDEASPITETWTVPYCLPTVNPHGNNQPAAPGNGNQGQNQDGFYEFGTLPTPNGSPVYIRDDATDTLFGPFDSGVRIKWVEANGATPTISEMGGNNGKGNGQAEAVGYQIRAQGDAIATYFDIDGNEIQTTCLVPPFPK